jgi:branched-chain amino acid transport system substrate-binding protein
MKISGLAKALLLTATLLAMTSGAQAQEIKLGWNGDLSGSSQAEAGQATVLGLQTAIDDVNAAGGVLGRKLKLVTRDDLAQPSKSIQNMSDLIDNEKVVAVFGPTNSGNALAWRHIPNQKKIPVIGTNASATDITKSVAGENYMFRVSIVDHEQVAGLLAYTKKNSASKKVGFMVETTGYGEGGLKDLRQVSESQGIKPVDVQKFAVTDTDMTSQLGKMKAEGVDTIIVWTAPTPLAQLFRSMEKINYYPLTLTSWAADQKAFFETAGPTLAERPLFMRTISQDMTAQERTLFDRMQPKMGPSAASQFTFVAQGYDSVMLLTLAIKQANSTDGDKVREALENLQTPYKGVIKTYVKPFSKANHDALNAKDYAWVKWKGGKLTSYSDDVTKSLSTRDFGD